MTLKISQRRVVLAILLWLCCWCVFANEIDQGMDAYFSGDYKRAQAVWRLAALNEKDARAMFNLGLLHEQERVASASQEQARDWYRKAADHGYVPAGFHLAQILLSKNDQDDEALLLIQKASQEGYAPAQRYLEKRGGVARVELKSENWILKKSPQRWTVQLLAFNELAKVKDFIRQHDLSKKAAFFREPSRGATFYKLVYGDYESKQAAQSAREALPAALRQHGPWLRRFSDVQTAIRASSE